VARGGGMAEYARGAAARTHHIALSTTPSPTKFLDSKLSRQLFSLTTLQTSQEMFNEKKASSQGMPGATNYRFRSPKKQCKNLFQTTILSQTNSTMKNRAVKVSCVKAKKVII